MQEKYISGMTYFIEDGFLCMRSSSPVSEAVAMIYFYGRCGPPPRDWSCILKTLKGNLDARLSFNPGDSLDPGSTAVARIRLLSPELLCSYLPLNGVFTLWEGKVVGDGRVFMHL